MNWFIIALFAPFFWSLASLIDKYLVKEFIKDKHSPGALIIFSSLIGLFASFFIFIFSSSILMPFLEDKILLFIAGFLNIFWIALYLFALRRDDVSAVIPWFLLSPVFSYFLGYFFLGEVLTLNQKIGSVIVLLGVFILSLDFSRLNRIKFKRHTFFYMLPASFLFAFTNLIFKYVTPVSSYWASSFWMCLGLGFAGILIFLFNKSYRNSFFDMIYSGGKKVLILNLSNEVLNMVGNLFTAYAILLAPLAMVYVVGSLQPIFLVLFTFLLSRFYPHIIRENIASHILIPKIIAILIIIFGGSMLFF